MDNMLFLSQREITFLESTDAYEKLDVGKKDLIQYLPDIIVNEPTNKHDHLVHKFMNTLLIATYAKTWKESMI